jgi:hypothetical protein
MVVLVSTQQGVGFQQETKAEILYLMLMLRVLARL